MLKDSGTERAELFCEHLNDAFPGSQTTWIGPPHDKHYVFDMRAAGKRIVVSERVLDLLGGSKPGLKKTLQHHGIDSHIAECPQGSELHIVPGNGEKPDFQTHTLHTMR